MKLTLEELLKGFKPVFGNDQHIQILEMSKRAGRKRELLRQSKAKQSQIKKLTTEAEEAEKRLLQMLQVDYDRRNKKADGDSTI